MKYVDRTFTNICIMVNHSFIDSLSCFRSRPGPVNFPLTVTLKLDGGREEEKGERGRERGRESDKDGEKSEQRERE